MSLTPWSPPEPHRHHRAYDWGIVFLAAAVVVLAVLALYLARATPPAPVRIPAPVVSPSPSPAPLIVTGTSSASSDTYLGAYWPSRHIVIDNQVGTWFTPILEAQAAAWESAGAPASFTILYGGAPACDNPPSGEVVICLHTRPTTPGEPAPDDGDTNFTSSCASASEEACPAISETVWLNGRLTGQRLANVVRHELGHLEGLGYDPDPASVMERHAPTSTITPADIANLQALYASAPPAAADQPVSGSEPASPPPAPVSPTPCTAIDLTLCGLIPLP